MVASLVELVPNLPDVGGNNHKVPVGESDEYIPITIPGRDNRGGELLIGLISKFHD